MRPPPLLARRAGAFALLLVLTAAIRLPFFFPAVIDWDESTFILIGQSLADGHLPYEQTWDVKPPLGFVFYAAVIRLLGRSVMAIRLGGALCVAITAFLVYVITSRIWRTSAAAWLAAALTVLGMSLLASAQATMTEHIMLVPFMAALAVVLRREPATPRWFAAGALLATATLIRFNAAFVAVAVAAFVYVDARRRSFSGLRALAMYCCGGASVVGLTIAVYVAAGDFDSFWITMVTSPWSYVDAQNSPVSTLIRQARNAFGLTSQPIAVPWLTSLLWSMAFAGFATAWLRWRAADEQGRRGLLLITLVAPAAATSVVMSGQPLEHYLLQLVPVAAISSAWLFHHANRRVRSLIWAATCVCAVLSSAPIIAEYRGLFTRVSRGEHVAYGLAYDLADYLNRENALRRPVFLLNEHLAYWLTKMPPPTRFATHPSAFSNSQHLLEAFGTTADDELRAVFRLRPEFVVVPETVWFMDCSLERVLRDSLTEGYVLDSRIGSNYVYRRQSPETVPGVTEPAAGSWATGCAR